MGVDLLAFLKFPTLRNYSLNGPENARAVQAGLASAEWYRTPVDRKLLKNLMQRNDGLALRDTAVWLGLLLACGLGGAITWATWLCVPFLLVYGVLYGSTADSRWHECGHGTAFKTPWINDVVYEIASFMMMRNSVVWRWSHARHHSDTIIVGRDPEISSMRPPQLILMGLNLFGLVVLPRSLVALVRNACARLSDDEADFVPDPERPRAYFVARVHIAIYAAVVAICFASSSILPMM